MTDSSDDVSQDITISTLYLQQNYLQELINNLESSQEGYRKRVILTGIQGSLQQFEDALGRLKSSQKHPEKEPAEVPPSETAGEPAGDPVAPYIARYWNPLNRTHFSVVARLGMKSQRLGADFVRMARALVVEFNQPTEYIQYMSTLSQAKWKTLSSVLKPGIYEKQLPYHSVYRVSKLKTNGLWLERADAIKDIYYQMTVQDAEKRDQMFKFLEDMDAKKLFNIEPESLEGLNLEGE